MGIFKRVQRTQKRCGIKAGEVTGQRGAMADPGQGLFTDLATHGVIADQPSIRYRLFRVVWGCAYAKQSKANENDQHHNGLTLTLENA